MLHSPLLTRLVEDELARAPLLMQQLIASIEAPVAGRSALAPDDRPIRGAVQRALKTGQADMIAAFVDSLREQVSAAAPAGAASRSGAKKLSLALVDEEEVSADVEIARAIEAINSEAEYELREFAAYTAALVGDVNMAHETNPLRAEVYARAVWAAVQSLPISRDHQIGLMRMLAMPLAQLLRAAYTAACTRLDDQGIEPAAFRTIILPPGSRAARWGGMQEATPTDLNQLRDSMPVPLDLPLEPVTPLDQALLRAEEMLRLLPDDVSAAARGRSLASQRSRLVESAPTRVDKQLIELLSRLFDAILADRALPAPALVLLSRLHASALRVALGDASMLDNYQHPVWLFIDRLAFHVEVLLAGQPGGEQSTSMQRLVDHIVQGATQDAALYRWGLDRLDAFEQHLLERRLGAAAAQIVALRDMEARGDASADEGSAETPLALDVASLDTVPASLMELDGLDEAVKATAATRWLRERDPGEILSLFLQGRRITAQLLWSSDSGQTWLLGELPAGAFWALRRGALLRLRAEGLAERLQPRSLVQAAAQAVLRGVEPPRAAPL